MLKGVINLCDAPLAMHVRRGDRCVYAEQTGAAPLCVPVEKYWEEARIVADKYSLQCVYVATESESVIETLRELGERDGLPVRYMQFNRTQVEAPFEFWYSP